MAQVPFMPPFIPLNILAQVASLEQLDDLTYGYASPILVSTMTPVQVSMTQHAPTSIVLHEDGSGITLR